jgi:hypothetical protein
MSSDPTQQAGQASVNPLDAAQIEQARRQVNQMAEEIAQLSEADMQPTQFYGEFLQRVYFAIHGFAAAIWVRTPQGNLQLQCQINLREVGLDRTPEARPLHDEMLRQAALQAKGGVIRPHFSHNFGTAQEQVAGNPTDYVIILVPIMQEKQVLGLVELWIEPNRAPNVQQNLHQFLVRMTAFISLYQRNHRLRQMLGQQDLWLKLETFSRQIHGSLHTTEVAYLIANEARRLIEVDRISVATRTGDKCVVTAISGADVVEKRSNLVQLMRALFDAVIEWGERLVYIGTKDDALPPKVIAALDAYLGESNSKVLVVMPLHDEREKDRKKLARSALIMESFETNLQPEQLLARLDVVGKHACSALYNAQEYRRIPMRFLWLPLARVQDGLGGKAKAITASVVTGVTILILAMIFMPFPLKMEANGQTLPKDRRWIYSPIPGTIKEIPAGLKSGSKVAKGQPLFVMFDSELEKQVNELQTDIAVLETKINAPGPKNPDPAKNEGADPVTLEEAKITRRKKIEMLNRLKDRTNADLAHPGAFTIIAPKAGIILSADFRENLIGKNVRPGDPLIRVGYTDPNHPKLTDWEIELKIPQKHVGQVNRAFERLPQGVEELDVDVMFVSQSTTSYRAKLRKDKIASQANTQKDDNNETEPIVIAWARIHPINNDIPEADQIPPAHLLTGSEVHTRIRCGYRAMGYSLFYGVYEFAYEKVFFPYFHW